MGTEAPRVADEQGPPAAVTEPRTRRSLLAAAAGAVGAFVAQALGQPARADAASIVLGSTNNATTATTIQNTASNAGAWAIVGRTTYTGAALASKGVYGISKGQHGTGVAGDAATGTNAKGVDGTAAEGIGVRGTGGHTGIRGKGSTYGAYGESPGYGVYGTSGYTGVYGTGSSYGTAGVGQVGAYGAGSGTGITYGVYGSGSTYGVYGSGGTGVSGSGGSTGVSGTGTSIGVSGAGGPTGTYGSGTNSGVRGSSTYVGVWGTGTSWGMYAEATGTTGQNYGIYAATDSPTSGFAGYFENNVYVAGSLTKAGGGFQVDHPLEPGDRYLVHSFVEAPERLNVYSGVVTLGTNGRATVQLPRYFEQANRDFRYQLTAIGAAAPDLHVASGVSGNAFVIAGGANGLQVSWQVTGVRADAWATANPRAVEPTKPTAARGRYLHPTLYGKPATASIHRLPDRVTIERPPAPTGSEPAKPTPPAG